MEKSVFYFPIWGESYIKLFSDFALKCLYKNLNEIDEESLKSSKIEIWTFKKDIPKLKKLKNIKILKKKIKINIEAIDLIYNDLIESNLNKYQTLSILQKIFINSHSYKFKYFWFIYPDFIFSNKMIYNFFSLKKKYDAYFIPVPQLIEEKVKLKFENNNFETNTKNITGLLFDFLHPIVKICDVDKSKTNTPSMFFACDQKSYVFKYFHMHPIVIKSDIDNLEMNNKFYSSLDEGLVKTLNKTKIFVTRNNYFAICISLLKEKEYLLPNEKFNLTKTLEWCKNHVNKTHLEISNYTYIATKKNSFKKNIKLENKIIKRLNPIKKMLLKFKDRQNIEDYNVKINVVELNDQFYKIIMNNHFKNYFKVNSNSLKTKIKKNDLQNPTGKWLKNLYLKNL